MNLMLVSRLLGIVSWLLGLTMAFSLPAAWPTIGGQESFEVRGFGALVSSIVVCLFVGIVLRYLGRDAPDTLFRKRSDGHRRAELGVGDNFRGFALLFGECQFPP